MSFAHPLTLLLLLLLIPVCQLYWLRLRAPRAVVGTGLFWEKALAEEPRRARWQRWRTPVSLVVQMLTVLLLTLAAAGPQIPPAQHIVLILDNSATMRATDVQPSRFDAAKAEAQRMIESLRWCDEMAVVTTNAIPHEVQPPTSDKKLLATAVDSIQAQSNPEAVGWAVKLAHEIGLSASSSKIMLITDARAKDAVRDAQSSGVEVFRVGTAAGNRAITCFTARRSKVDPAQCEVFVEMQNRSDQSAQGSVELSVDDKPGESTPFAIEKDGRWQHLFQLMLPTAATLKVRITPGDTYPFDDTAELELPAAPALHNVTGTLPVPLEIGTRSVPDTLRPPIQIFDGNAPEKLPPGPLLIFTPTACDLWTLGDPVADPLVTHVDEASPVLAGVRLFDAYLPEARQLQLADSVRAIAKPVLWAGKTPLGYAIDRSQGRVVVVCGNLATSNLPLQADFPKLEAQALDWLAGQAPWNDKVIVSGIANGSHDMADVRIPGDIGIEARSQNYWTPSLPLWIPLAALAALLVILEWCLYQRRWTS